MILVTHSIIGTSLGVLQSSPYAAFFVGLVSHFLTDMIPHWEYSVAGLKKAAEKSELKKTLLKIFLDGLLGVVAPIWIFSIGGFVTDWQSFLVLFAAILGAMIPDALQGVKLVFNKNRLLHVYQTMHDSIHYAIFKDNLNMREHPVLGITLQVLLCFGFLAFAFYFG